MSQLINPSSKFSRYLPWWSTQHPRVVRLLADEKLFDLLQLYTCWPHLPTKHEKVCSYQNGKKQKQKTQIPLHKQIISKRHSKAARLAGLIIYHIYFELHDRCLRRKQVGIIEVKTMCSEMCFLGSGGWYGFFHLVTIVRICKSSIQRCQSTARCCQLRLKVCNLCMKAFTFTQERWNTSWCHCSWTLEMFAMKFWCLH